VKLTGKNILLVTAACAIAARVIFALLFSNSAFANYHLVPGLDMQTLLHYSEWGEGKNYAPFFTFHRLIIFLIWFINSQHHSVWAIFTIQALVGVAGCVCMADIVLKLSGKRTAALICGIAGAFYLPLLVYEFSVLKETFAANFALFAFWSMLYALRKRFNVKSSLLFGFCCFAALEGRLAIVPLVGVLGMYCLIKMFRRKLLKRVLAAAVLPLFLLLAASSFNAINWYFSPFFDVLNYNLQYNAGDAAKTAAAADAPENAGNSKTKLLINTICNAAKQAPQLLKYGELPENQNIYFWCKKIPAFNILLAPGLLIPLTSAGIMILLLSGAWKHRYGLLLLPLLSLALPLCAREPIGRYRLILVPYFLMITACAAVVVIRMKSVCRRRIAFFGAGLGAFFSIFHGDVPVRIRQSDYSAYAVALEHTPGTPSTIVVDAYYDYWESHRFQSERAYKMLMDKSLKYKAFETIEAVSVQALANGISPDLVCYFMAWSFALQEKPEQVSTMLASIKDPAALPPEYRQKAALLHRDTLRILRIRRKMR